VTRSGTNGDRRVRDLRPNPVRTRRNKNLRERLDHAPGPGELRGPRTVARQLTNMKNLSVL